jgi:hypothetical protein
MEFSKLVQLAKYRKPHQQMSFVNERKWHGKQHDADHRQKPEHPQPVKHVLTRFQGGEVQPLVTALVDDVTCLEQRVLQQEVQNRMAYRWLEHRATR